MPFTSSHTYHKNTLTRRIDGGSRADRIGWIHRVSRAIRIRKISSISGISKFRRVSRMRKDRSASGCNGIHGAIKILGLDGSVGIIR